MDEGDEEYSNVYDNEQLKFKNESSVFALKRCLLLNQYQSYKNDNNLDSCILLEEEFKNYCDYFDTKNVTSDVKGETLTSGLSKVNWRDLVDDQPCSCNLVNTKEVIESVIKKSESESSVKRSNLTMNTNEPSGSVFKPSKWSQYKDAPEDDKKSGIYNQRIGGKISKGNRYDKSDKDRMDESEQKYGIYFQRVGGKFKKWNQSEDDTGEISQHKNRKRVQDDEDSGGGIYYQRLGGKFKKWNQSEDDTSESSQHKNCKRVQDDEDSGGGIYNQRLGGKLKKWNLAEDTDEPSYKGRKSQDGENTSGIYNQRIGGKFKKLNQNEDLYDNVKPNLDGVFKTASNIMENENQENRFIRSHNDKPVKKSLGGKRSVLSKFVSPFQNTVKNESQEDYNDPSEIDDRLKNIDPKMIELIKNEIIDNGTETNWDDIAGLNFAKNKIQEIVVWPMLRPDIFTGLRRPPKGILLFGPPGTGKTLIGKCIASQSKSTFFSISASSLTSKWMGEGEKMVRALFAVARVHQPAVVFIDEIDSLLSQRSETEHEGSRRMKTEFLVQLDGAGTGEEDRILVIGATNRPQELDEAARRRLVKRLYIPLPDDEARKQIVTNLMNKERNSLTANDIDTIAELTNGFSGADMKNLCQDACLGPIRSIDPSKMANISADNVRPVNLVDFQNALKYVKSSVSSQDLEQYIKWDGIYGSGTG